MYILSAGRMCIFLLHFYWKESSAGAGAGCAILYNIFLTVAAVGGFKKKVKIFCACLRQSWNARKRAEALFCCCLSYTIKGCVPRLAGRVFLRVFVWTGK